MKNFMGVWAEEKNTADEIELERQAMQYASCNIHGVINRIQAYLVSAKFVRIKEKLNILDDEYYEMKEIRDSSLKILKKFIGRSKIEVGVNIKDCE